MVIEEPESLEQLVSSDHQRKLQLTYSMNLARLVVVLGQ
jgi:hypothetical protein